MALQNMAKQAPSIEAKYIHQVTHTFQIKNVKYTKPINFNFLRLTVSNNDILSSTINKGTQATNAKMVKGSNQLALNNKALIRANKTLGVFLITLKISV